MNAVTLSLLVLVSASAVPTTDQKPAANAPRVSACAVFTREVAAKVVTSKAALDSRPVETPAGARGSQCEYAGIIVQIDSFAGNGEAMRKSPRKEWTPLAGVGDAAYFNNVKDVVAEVIVWTGSHHFGVLMDVPTGSTAEQIKPALIQVANLIIPKLK